MVGRDGISDHALVCMNPCCEQYWCSPCMICFLMRHDLTVKQPGTQYEGCCNPTGTSSYV